MNTPWFDPVSGHLLLDEYVVNRPSFQQIMEDGVITEAELAAQADHLVAILRELEQKLSPETKALATDALCELAVLSALQVKHLESGH